MEGNQKDKLEININKPEEPAKSEMDDSWSDHLDSEEESESRSRDHVEIDSDTDKDIPVYPETEPEHTELEDTSEEHSSGDEHDDHHTERHSSEAPDDSNRATLQLDLNKRNSAEVTMDPVSLAQTTTDRHVVGQEVKKDIEAQKIIAFEIAQMSDSVTTETDSSDSNYRPHNLQENNPTDSDSELDEVVEKKSSGIRGVFNRMKTVVSVKKKFKANLFKEDLHHEEKARHMETIPLIPILMLKRSLRRARERIKTRKRLKKIRKKALNIFLVKSVKRELKHSNKNHHDLMRDHQDELDEFGNVSLKGWKKARLKFIHQVSQISLPDKIEKSALIRLKWK